MLNNKIFLLLFLFLPIVSAVDVNNTLFVNSITNYSIYINETVTFDGVNVTSTGRIEFYNLNTTLTIGKFYNLNDTYNSVIDIYNLTNSLIYYENRTVLQQEFTGNINISIPILHSLIIMNNYIIDDGENPSSGDNVNRGGGPGDTQIDNTLLEPLLIQIQNLDRSFIFMSNSTVLRFLNGDLNITLSEDDYFYIVDYEELLALNENDGTTAHDTSGNSNDGTITGAIWVTDGILVTLTEVTDYTINAGTGLFTIVNNDYSWSELLISWSYTSSESRNDLDNIKGNYLQLLVNESGQLPIVGTIIGISILLAILISLLIFAIKRMIGVGNITIGKSNSNFTGSSRSFS